jgi:ferredoxin
VNAIYAEEDLPADQQHMIPLNAELALLPGWKSITKRKIPMPDADAWKDKTGKLAHLIR